MQPQSHRATEPQSRQLVLRLAANLDALGDRKLLPFQPARGHVERRRPAVELRAVAFHAIQSIDGHFGEAGPYRRRRRAWAR